jgi:hypothetical protein
MEAITVLFLFIYFESIFLVKFYGRNTLYARTPTWLVIFALLLFLFVSVMSKIFGDSGFLVVQIALLSIVGIFGGLARQASSLIETVTPSSEEIGAVIFVHLFQNLVIASMLANALEKKVSWWGLFKPATAFGLLSWFLCSFAISFLIYFLSKRKK